MKELIKDLQEFIKTLETISKDLESFEDVSDAELGEYKDWFYSLRSESNFKMFSVR